MKTIIHIDPLWNDSGPWETTCGAPFEVGRIRVDHSENYHASPKAPETTDCVTVAPEDEAIWCPRCVELLPMAMLARIDNAD